jgi:hypothetical protein
MQSLIRDHFPVLEEFVAAGDFLAYKFPVWSWYDLHSFDSTILDS